MNMIEHWRKRLAECDLPWDVTTSNNWRRIVDADLCEVIAPAVAHYDGHPDIDGKKWLQLAADAVNDFPGLLDEVERLRDQVAVLTDAPQSWNELQRKLVDSTEARAEIAKAELQRLHGEHRKLTEILREPYHPEHSVLSWCPVCGALPRCDDDGTCSQCGATCGAVPNVTSLRKENKLLHDAVELRNDTLIAVAVAAERERCAKVAQSHERYGYETGGDRTKGYRIAAAIRTTPEGD